MCEIIPMQGELSQELPVILGNVDYQRFRETLLRMEELIKLGGLEEIAMKHLLDKAEQAGKSRSKEEGSIYEGLSVRSCLIIQKTAIRALRCGIARHLTGESFRRFSCRLADSVLFQKFCRIERFESIKVPSKSTLERYEKMLPEQVIREMVIKLTKGASQETQEGKKQKLDLSSAISLDECYIDSTCVKANIHFPVDWVLLRDATRTLMKSVKLIRKGNLKNRMGDPKDFIREMNKLCINMTHTNYKRGGKKKRKKILRLMKDLMKKIERHAGKHKELLKEHWKEAGLTEGQARQIIDRIEGVLEQLPSAIWQAHERIIGERQVKNNEKTLSLYEQDIHVIVKGKSGARTEFGNTLLIAEQIDGIIVDWKAYKGQAPADSNTLKEALERMNEMYGKSPETLTTDRGYFSQANQEYLEKEKIEDCMCPDSVEELRERMQDKSFREKQKRRAQTEGRIGVLKNSFLGKPMKSKGFIHRDLRVAWGILTHNLWVIARLPKAKSKELRNAA